MTLAHQPRQLLDQLSHTRGVGGLTFDDELVALRAYTHVQQRFDSAEVVVVGPNEGLEGRLGDGNLTQRRGRNARIS